MYRNGLGVPVDNYRAVEWFLLSAHKGMANGKNNLGVMYDDGQVVFQDYTEAVPSYKLSAEQGLARAQLNLGAMNAEGHGVKQDYSFAYMWWNIAGAIGDENSLKNLKLVSKQMSPDEIVAARLLAEECLASGLTRCD